VKKANCLYEIDERPYQYALETAVPNRLLSKDKSETSNGRLQALMSAVSVSQANTHSAEADVTNSAQGVNRARAEWTYANNNLHRLEPLLAKQFVTADQVDRARTSELVLAQALLQAESGLQLSQQS